MLYVEDLTRATWHCLHFVSPEEAGSVREELSRSGLAVFEIDGNAIETKDQLLAMVAQAMRLPDYFGMNWDALDECLREPDWLPAGGCILFFRGAEPFWKRAHHLAGTFTEIWLSAAEDWGREGRPFHLVFVW